MQRFEGVLQTAKDTGLHVPVVHSKLGATLQLKESHKPRSAGLLLYGVYQDPSIPVALL